MPLSRAHETACRVRRRLIRDRTNATATAAYHEPPDRHEPAPAGAETAAPAKSERQTAGTRRAHKARDPTACVISDARPWARLSHKLRTPALTARDERTGRAGSAPARDRHAPARAGRSRSARIVDRLTCRSSDALARRVGSRRSLTRGCSTLGVEAGTLAPSLTKAGAGICVDATRVRLRIARLARAGRVRVRVLGLVWCLSRTSGSARGTSGG